MNNHFSNFPVHHTQYQRLLNLIRAEEDIFRRFPDDGLVEIMPRAMESIMYQHHALLRFVLYLPYARHHFHLLKIWTESNMVIELKRS